MPDRPTPPGEFRLHPSTSNAPGVRRGRLWLLVCLALFAAVVWFAMRPHEVGTSWRECDTMAIARNFLVDGFDPLRPRVDWRGDTDGAVECEFPLFQLMIATTLYAFGEVEWPARLLSLLAMIGAAFSLHRLLEWRAGPGPALIGSIVFLGGAQAILLASRVQPDGLSTALTLAGVVTFVRYLGSGSNTALWLATAALTLGSLQKPTALQIVGMLGLWTAILAPRRLREPRFYVAGATCFGVVALWLWHGVGLYAETGLTFGVMSAGETKFPGARHLLDLHIWKNLLATTARLGLSPFGLVALCALVLRRRLGLDDLALFAAVGIGLVVSMRYSSDPGAGPHYHVFAAVAGAWCVARVWPRRAPWWLWSATLLAVLAIASHWVDKERDKLRRCTDNGTLRLAATIRETFAPDELGVLRGHREGYDAFWNRRTNYEQPMLFYQSRRRGWILPRDGFEVEELEQLLARGARFVVDPLPKETAPEVEAWLDAHGERVIAMPAGNVYRLSLD